jgi:vacuolar-type H+-ATPase subunit H
MEILNLLDKLESMVTTSGRIPATKKAMVDMDRLLDLVDQIRLALPKEVQEAEEILMKRESVLNTALLEARRIKADADNQSRSRVDESTVVKEANQRAEDVLADAKRKSDLMLQDAQRKALQIAQDAEAFSHQRVGEASQYAQDVLLRLEQQLSTVLNSIRRGLDTLDTAGAMAQNAAANSKSGVNGKNGQHKKEVAVG